MTDEEKCLFALKKLHLMAARFEEAMRLYYVVDRQLTFFVPSLIPRRGEISYDGATSSFWFHGSTCELQRDGLVVSYEIGYSRINEFGSTLFYLWRFLQQLFVDEYLFAGAPVSDSLGMMELKRTLLNLIAQRKVATGHVGYSIVEP